MGLPCAARYLINGVEANNKSVHITASQKKNYNLSRMASEIITEAEIIDPWFAALQHLSPYAT